MERKDSIFFRVSSENENSTTELLCNILRVKYARDVFLKICGVDVNLFDTISLDNISTQSSLLGIGRPDIVIESRGCLYFIENKIGIRTTLQKSQITTYPEYIDTCASQHKGLVFLIPRNYLHEPEIINAGKKYDFIKIIYWDDLLRTFGQHDIGKDSPVIKEALNYFEELVIKKSLDTKLTPYEAVMMYNMREVYEVLSFIDKTNAVVNSAVDKALNLLGGDFSKSHSQSDISGHGWYINYKSNSNCLFIGLNPVMYTEKNGEYVFSAAISADVTRDDYKIDANYKYIDLEDGGEHWIYVALDRKLLLEDDQSSALAEAVMDIINEVFLKICKA